MRTFFGSNGSKTSFRRVSVLCRTSGTNSPACRLRLGITVAQTHRAVEDEPARPRIRIEAEIALALELHRRIARRVGERGLEAGVAHHVDGIRVDVGEEIASGAGIG